MGEPSTSADTKSASDRGTERRHAGLPRQRSRSDFRHCAILCLCSFCIRDMLLFLMIVTQRTLLLRPINLTPFESPCRSRLCRNLLTEYGYGLSRGWSRL